MSRLSSLIAASLVLLLTAVSEALYYDDSTATPDYELEYNATFDYSFYSNTSIDDLEKFLKGGFINPDEPEEPEEPEGTEGTDGQEEAVTTAATTAATTAVTTDVTTGVTMGVPKATAKPKPTEKSGGDVYSAASLPVHLDFRTLVWTLMILISLNVPQLQHTL